MLRHTSGFGQIGHIIMSDAVYILTVGEIKSRRNDRRRNDFRRNERDEMIVDEIIVDEMIGNLIASPQTLIPTQWRRQEMR